MKNTFLLAIFFLVSSFVFISGNDLVNDWITPEVEYPADNPFSEESINLGGSLFFETLLSRDSSVSCQSCHLITEGFADHLPVGEGIDNRKVTRNSPSLINIGFHPYLMKDGKFASLEEQVLGPINDHREFDLNPEEVVKRLRSVPMYEEMSVKAYGRQIDIDVVQKALANFQRALVSDRTKFDDYMRGDKDALNASALRGWNLFKSEKLNCTACHHGFDFSDYSFQNNGLYKVYADSGRALITKSTADIGKFKVPSLRNVVKTYPYMHDGSVQTLSEVIDNYSKGGSKHFNQSTEIRSFQLNGQEKTDLLNFFEALTDTLIFRVGEE